MKYLSTRILCAIAILALQNPLPAVEAAFERITEQRALEEFEGLARERDILTGLMPEEVFMQSLATRSIEDIEKTTKQLAQSLDSNFAQWRDEFDRHITFLETHHPEESARIQAYRTLLGYYSRAKERRKSLLQWQYINTAINNLPEEEVSPAAGRLRQELLDKYPNAEQELQKNTDIYNSFQKQITEYEGTLDAITKQHIAQRRATLNALTEPEIRAAYRKQAQDFESDFASFARAVSAAPGAAQATADIERMLTNLQRMEYRIYVYNAQLKQLASNRIEYPELQNLKRIAQQSYNTMKTDYKAAVKRKYGSFFGWIYRHRTGVFSAIGISLVAGLAALGFSMPWILDKNSDQNNRNRTSPAQ